jgi:hypothetical protein
MHRRLQQQEENLTLAKASDNIPKCIALINKQ